MNVNKANVVHEQYLIFSFFLMYRSFGTENSLVNSSIGVMKDLRNAQRNILCMNDLNVFNSKFGDLITNNRDSSIQRRSELYEASIEKRVHCMKDEYLDS